MHNRDGTAMIAGATYEQSLATRKHHVLPNGTGFWKSEYIVSRHDVLPAPQAFLVEQDPDQVILPHFHEQNQFQIIVHGGGTLGRTVVAPITVHYAGAYTGYGPITSGNGGLWYMTLRPMMDNGALFVHESRDKMKPGPKKHYHSEQIAVMSDEALSKLAGIQQESLNADPQGPTVRIVRIPPMGRLMVDDQMHCGGIYLFVARGSLIVDRAAYRKWSCVWVQGEDSPIEVAAGEGGSQVLLLGFPRTDYRITYSPSRYKYAD